MAGAYREEPVRRKTAREALGLGPVKPKVSFKERLKAGLRKSIQYGPGPMGRWMPPSKKGLLPVSLKKKKSEEEATGSGLFKFGSRDKQIEKAIRKAKGE